MVDILKFKFIKKLIYKHRKFETCYLENNMVINLSKCYKIRLSYKNYITVYVRKVKNMILNQAPEIYD